MVKFFKGHYLFTETEVRKLMLLLGKQEFTEYNGKNYLCLEVEKKSQEVNMAHFKEVIFVANTKKDMIDRLGTSQYKFAKFCKDNFNTENINDIRFIVKNIEN